MSLNEEAEENVEAGLMSKTQDIQRPIVCGGPRCWGAGKPGYVGTLPQKHTESLWALLLTPITIVGCKVYKDPLYVIYLETPVTVFKAILTT